MNKKNILLPKNKKIPNTKKILQKTIWVTGCARSGTSILGLVLSTLNNVEYSHEPETLFTLLPLIDKIKKKIWKQIFETYLIEDTFFNLCVGRTLNFRKNDFSSIYNALTKKQIQRRLKLNLRRKDFDAHIKNNNKKYIIKVPDLTKSFVKLQKYYPQNKFIIIKRNNKSIISSINRKNWFQKNNYGAAPLYFNKNWLSPKLYKIWINSNNQKRAEIYIDNFEKDIKKIKNKLVVNYESLIKNPNKVIKEICTFLNLKKTQKTKEAINKIYSQ
jgi:hypothetical protein